MIVTMKHPLVSGVIAVPIETNILLLQQHNFLMLPPNPKTEVMFFIGTVALDALGSSEVLV